MSGRILGIVGGVLLVIGVFCPIAEMSLQGTITSITFKGGVGGESWQATILIVIGVAGIALAALRRTKLVLFPGILALAILAYEYFNFKTIISKMVFVSRTADPRLQNEFSMKWGWMVLLLGSLVLLSSAATRSDAPERY